jgi:hypothetical protein
MPEDRMSPRKPTRESSWWKAVRGGMTQTGAASKFGVSLRAVSKWMKLQPQAARDHRARAFKKVLRACVRLCPKTGKVDHGFERLTHRNVVVDDEDHRRGVRPRRLRITFNC